MALMMAARGLQVSWAMFAVFGATTGLSFVMLVLFLKRVRADASLIAVLRISDEKPAGSQLPGGAGET